MWLIWSLLGNDHICRPPRLWDLQNPRGLDRAGGPVVCQWCIEDFTEGSAVLLPCITLGITQGHGPERCSSPRCPLLLCQVNLLPLVWQGRQKWRNHGQPLVDNALQARASLQLMSLLSLNHPGGHLTSWPSCKQPKGSDSEEEDGGPGDVSTSD